ACLRRSLMGRSQNGPRLMGLKTCSSSPTLPFSSGKERGNQMCQSCAFGRSWLVANSPACSCQVVGVLQNCLTVTAEVASSSLVVPAILFSSCYALKKRAWAHSWQPRITRNSPRRPDLSSNYSHQSCRLGGSFLFASSSRDSW